MKKEDWLTTFTHQLQRLGPDISRREAHQVGLALYGDGSAEPAAAATRFATEWDKWMMSFVQELRGITPTMSITLATTIGAVLHAREPHSSPKQAAHSYAKKQRRKRSA
jgi:hypothetical protein